MKQTTRDAILREATRQLAAAGADGLTMSRVAEAVGIRPASVFHHFPGGKAEVEKAIHSTVTLAVAEILSKEFASGDARDPVEAVVEMAGAFWDLFHERPELAALMVLRTSSQDFSVGGPRRAEAVALLEGASSFIRRAQERGQIAPFDLRLLFVPTTLMCVSYHGAPGLRTLVESTVPDAWDPREAYIQVIRRLLEGGS